jgi:hypothetical protein
VNEYLNGKKEVEYIRVLLGFKKALEYDERKVLWFKTKQKKVVATENMVTCIERVYHHAIFCVRRGEK